MYIPSVFLIRLGSLGLGLPKWLRLCGFVYLCLLAFDRRRRDGVAGGSDFGVTFFIISGGLSIRHEGDGVRFVLCVPTLVMALAGILCSLHGLFAVFVDGSAIW